MANSLMEFFPAIAQIGKKLYVFKNRMEVIRFATGNGEVCWGREAAKKWLMKVTGWNEVTALRVICLEKILSSAAANQE